MAALLLGEQLVTVLPLPAGALGRTEVAAAFQRHPPYARLMGSWRWSLPLWREGVIVSLLDGHEDAMADVRAACGRIRHEDAWAGLKPFLHAGLFDEPSPAEFLDVVSSDLLKGGPDPGVSLPMAAGLDAFALTAGLVPTRSGASVGGSTRGASSVSIAQRAERRLGKTLFSLAMPVLTQCAASTMLTARAELAAPLRGLRTAIARAAAGAGQTDPAAAVREAATAYADAFEAFARPRVGRDDEDSQQILDGFVRVEGRVLPADAALISALAAWRQVRPAGARGGPDSVRAGAFFSLVVEPMGLRPDGAGKALHAQTGDRP